MKRNVNKFTYETVRPMQINMFVGPFWIAKGEKFLHVDNEDSKQTARMRRLNCLSWAHISEGTFSHVVTHINATYQIIIIIINRNKGVKERLQTKSAAFPNFGDQKKNKER